MNTFETHIEYLSEKIPLRGILVRKVRREYEIWFPYSIETVRALKINLLLGVRNLSSLRMEPVPGVDEDRYSIMRVSSIEIHHSEVAQVSEAKGEISIEDLINKDSTQWNRTVNDPEVKKLRIIVGAEDTGKEVYYPGSLEGANRNPRIVDSKSDPSQGGIVYVWKSDIVNNYLNRAYSVTTDRSVIELGKHRDYSSPAVPVNINIDELVKKHFAIFGFTGSGKSNLLSTLISKIMSKEGPRHVVIYDVNNEYFGLLFDLLPTCDLQILLLEDSEFFGYNVKQYLYGNFWYIQRAAQEMYRQFTFSGAIRDCFKDESYKNRVLMLIGYMLAKGKVKVFTQDMTGASLGRLLERIKTEYIDKNKFMTKGKSVKNEVADSLFAKLCSVHDENVVANVRHLNRYLELLDDVADYYKSGDTSKLKFKEDPVVEYMISIPDKDDLYKEYQPWIANLRKFIKSLMSETEDQPDCVFKMNMEGFVNTVHGNSKTVTLVLGEHDKLRNYSRDLGFCTMQLRKKFGELDHPPVLFMFDEADVFISSKNVGEEDPEAVKNSRYIAKTIARRGRKYNVGLGIATQRVRNLDTDIMSQPQTYFVGKLMRESDRIAVADGFGIEQNILDPDGLGVGEWIVISHSALGQKSEPMPVRFENADDRLIKFITDDKMATGEELGVELKDVGIYSAMGEKSSAFIIKLKDPDYLPSIVN